MAKLKLSDIQVSSFITKDIKGGGLVSGTGTVPKTKDFDRNCTQSVDTAFFCSKLAACNSVYYCDK